MTNTGATILGAVIGGICALIAALLGAYCSIRWQARRNAQQTFSDSVHDILSGMYPEPIDWPKNSWDVLQNKMPELQTAVGKLKFHLRPAEIASIDAAWEKYKKWCLQINDAEIAARPLYKDTMPSIDQKAVFKHHVDSLFCFSKRQ